MVELGKSGACESLVEMLSLYYSHTDLPNNHGRGEPDPFGDAAVTPSTGRFVWDAAEFTYRAASLSEVGLVCRVAGRPCGWLTAWLVPCVTGPLCGW